MGHSEVLLSSRDSGFFGILYNSQLVVKMPPWHIFSYCPCCHLESPISYTAAQQDRGRFTLSLYPFLWNEKEREYFWGNSPCQHSYKIEPSCVYNWELLGEGSIIKLPSVYWSPNISVDFCRTAMRYKYKYIYELSANICRQGCMEAPEKCRSKILKLAITRWPAEACQSPSCSDR